MKEDYIAIVDVEAPNGTSWWDDSWGQGTQGSRAH